MGFNVSWFAWAREQFTSSSNSEPGRHNSAGHLRSSDKLPPTSKAPPSETTEHDDGSIPACLYLPKFSSFRVLIEKGDKGQIQAEEPKPGMLDVKVRILRLIDAGGQGCVFQAEETYHRVQADGSLDVEPSGRQEVALKVAVAWMDEDAWAKALSHEGTAVPLKDARAALAHDPGYLGLMDEVEIYGWMRRASCVPYLYWHGLHFPAPTLDDRVADKRPVLCLLSMELLGPSIRSWQLAVRSADTPQAHSLSVIRLARHMLQTLQQLHRIGVVHRDIKPNNFCLPPSCKPPPGGSLADVSIQDLDKIFLIDFGLAHFIGPPKTGKGLHARVLREAELARELAGEPEKKVRESDFVGTPDYASTAALHGKRQTFWDDLESLGITLMSLYDARPWRIRSTQFPRNSWGNWEESQLSRMAHQRQETWKRKVDPKTLRPNKEWTNPPPWWVVEWISVVSSDMRPRASRQTVHTLESTFTHLHSLLNVGEKEVLASSKPVLAGMAVGNKRARMDVDAWDEVHKHTRLTLAEE